MAQLLGFENRDQLEPWAEEFPHLWGNESGGYMFECASAFDGAEHLFQIADWWDDVAQRIEDFNKDQKSSN